MAAAILLMYGFEKKDVVRTLCWYKGASFTAAIFQTVFATIIIIVQNCKWTFIVFVPCQNVVLLIYVTYT
jgi:hypothetical protein